MFDMININLNVLPISDKDKLILEKAIEFQTKSFDSLMQRYYINDNYELQIMRFDVEEVPAEERPHPDPNHKFHFFGSIRHINEEWVNTDYTGGINFYTSVDEYWFEFDGKVIDGKVVEITGGREMTDNEKIRLERENKLKGIL